jgi:RNA polymerase sigma-70 factor (TIGR02960 family)
MGDKFRVPVGSYGVMTATRLRRAGDEQAFRELTDAYRGELQAHCYRIVGSVQDAEDMVQETLLAAWRGLDGYEGRASLRAWLYRIATNRCLNALRDNSRRPREVPPVHDPPPPTRRSEPLWLEPYPDNLIDAIPDVAPGPDARYELKESMTLAFVAALQRLPPRQRATLLLRDVLGFRAAEVAQMLDATEDSVTSALKRARATVDRGLPAGWRNRSPTPRSRAERALVARFAEAFEADEIDAVVALLTEDAKLTMPPEPLEYEGHATIAAFLRERCSSRVGRGFRLVPIRANTQPAFACYLKDARSPVARPHGLIVLTLAGDRISALTRFLDNSSYPHFGLPRMLAERG